jgi:hypothetical protein
LNTSSIDDRPFAQMRQAGGIAPVGAEAGQKLVEVSA